MTQADEKKSSWWNWENLSTVIGPDGIQTSNEVRIESQVWGYLFLLVAVIFILFVLVPKLLK